jgi:hypothetical protein
VTLSEYGSASDFLSIYFSPTTAFCLHNLQNVRMSYLIIFTESIAENQQLAVSQSKYTYAAVCILSYICRFKIIKQYLHRILKDKIYKQYKIYTILCPNICCEPLLISRGRDHWLWSPVSAVIVVTLYCSVRIVTVLWLATSCLLSTIDSLMTTG